jgi:hypothetical protein
MKKVLYYAIKMDGLYGPKMVAVTTERGNRWWGRDLRDDLGTHGRAHQLAGRFEKIEDGKAVMDEVNKAVIHFAGERAKLEAALTRLRGAKQQTLREITGGSPQRGAERLTVEVIIK